MLFLTTIRPSRLVPALLLALAPDAYALSVQPPDAAAALNRQILSDRARLTAIADQYLQSDDISEADFLWLKALADQYGLQPRQRGDQSFFNALLARVDIIPASLLAAHALLEGRHAGQAQCGPCRAPHSLMKPAAPDWPAIFRAVNTDPAFDSFRLSRSKLHLSGRSPRGTELAPTAGGLISGQGYGNRLEHTIRTLRLGRLDTAPAP